jgi:predicted permease
MPAARLQFRILYRDFLRRIVDLEVLSSHGEVERLLVQFAALLAAFNFSFLVFTGPKYLTGHIPAAQLYMAIGSDLEFLVSATMAIAGLFAVLAWNSVLPGRRDALILGLLPVRSRTVLIAKIAAIASALGVAIVALNVFTGFTLPFAAPEGALRALAGYWLTMAAAGAFVCCAMLALQGLALQLLPYRGFLRVSSFLQLAAFFAVLGAWFLRPPTAVPWLPSTWFFHLQLELSGTAPTHSLAGRALWALLIAGLLAATTFALAYARSTRRIVEQPDILPTPRRRAPRLGHLLFRRPIDRAIVFFTARTIARSREHRLFLAAYAGIGLAIAFAYARDLIYGTDDPYARSLARQWDQPNAPLLMAGVVLLCFAVAGARGIFALPIALRANWIFQLTAVHSPTACFRAVRKALVAVTVAPIWLACAAAYFLIWPAQAAAQHMLLLSLAAAILVHRALANFRKIPFTCSYLPGKSNLHVKIGVYALAFIAVSAFAVQIEFETLGRPMGFMIYSAIWLGAAAHAWRRWREFAVSPDHWLQFEDLLDADIESLDLHHAPTGPRPGLPPPDEDAGSIRPRPIFAFESAVEPEPSVPFTTRLGQFGSDLRAGLRVFRRAPAFSAAAVALMAVGIGGNTAIFSLINGIFNKPAAGVRAEGLVNLALMTPGDTNADVLALAIYNDFLAHSQTLASIAACGFERIAMTASEGTWELRSAVVTPNYFDTLGVPIVRGRGFTPGETTGAAGLATVIAWHVWQNQFQSAPGILGRQVLVNGMPATIVGVAAPGFRGTHFAPNFEIAMPVVAYDRIRGNPQALARRGVEAIGRLAPGVSLEQAQAEFDAVSQSIAASLPDLAGRRIVVSRHSTTAFGPWQSAQAKMFLAVITVVALLTLLVVCANVANLMLGRSAARQREFAVRQSLGASRPRILSLLFAEGLALSVAAAGAAWLFAWWVSRALPSLIPPLESGARINPDLGPDWRVAAYALALAAGGALVFTLAPSLRSRRLDLLPFLKAGEQGVVQGRSRMANVLVVVQLAFCVLLLGGAGLAIRSAGLISAADLGYPKDHRLILRLNTLGAGRAQNQRALLESLRQRIAAIPKVAAVSYATAVPPDPFGQMTTVTGGTRVNAFAAGPRYLEALGVRVQGRDFAEADAARDAAILTQRMETALFPGQSALGRTVELFGRPWEVIGVVPNGAYCGLREQGGDQFAFTSRFDSEGPGAGVRYFNIRYSGPLAPVAGAVRAVVRDASASERMVGSIQTMDAFLHQYTAPALVASSLLSVFAAGALVVAGVGLYAVIAFHTARRRREFGIRLALGATPGDLSYAVLKEGLLLAAAGSAIGLALSAVTSRLLSRFLFGVSPIDPLTWAGVIGLLASVALTACYLPARKAAKVAPLEALRQE